MIKIYMSNNLLKGWNSSIRTWSKPWLFCEQKKKKKKKKKKSKVYLNTSNNFERFKSKQRLEVNTSKD